LIGRHHPREVIDSTAQRRDVEGAGERDSAGERPEDKGDRKDLEEMCSYLFAEISSDSLSRWERARVREFVRASQTLTSVLSLRERM